MSRSHRLGTITLASCAASWLLFACSDGQIEGDESSQEPPVGAAGSAQVPLGGASSTGQGASTSGGVPSSPAAGQAPNGGVPAMGGRPAAGGTAGAVSGSGGRSGAAGAPVGTGGGGSPSAGAGGTTATAGASGSGNAPTCDDDEVSCAGTCVDPRSSDQHCGGCSKPCGSGQTCDDGQCSGETSGGVTTCSSVSDFGVVSSTIVVKNGQTYDGKCRRFRADPDELGDGSQDEGQQPVFIVQNGGRLVNVVLGAPAADGIHTEGSVTLENITWEDIGEDALTIKESGTVVLNGGSAKSGDDKIFQINAAATFRLSNFKASNAGKLIRQNGGTTFKAQVFIDKCDISNMDESIFRTDSSSSTVSMTNTRYHAIGDSLFIGVSAGNITQSNNTEY